MVLYKEVLITITSNHGYRQVKKVGTKNALFDNQLSVRYPRYTTEELSKENMAKPLLLLVVLVLNTEGKGNYLSVSCIIVLSYMLFL